jgi:hypothetical protein
VEEAAGDGVRRGGGTRGAARDRWRRGRAGWADGHNNAGRKQRSEHRDVQTGLSMFYH